MTVACSDGLMAAVFPNFLSLEIDYLNKGKEFAKMVKRGKILRQLCRFLNLEFYVYEKLHFCKYRPRLVNYKNNIFLKSGSCDCAYVCKTTNLYDVSIYLFLKK